MMAYLLTAQPRYNFFPFTIYSILVYCSTSVTEEFKLNTFDSNAATDKAVEAVRFNGGGTKTDAAIQYAVDNIFPISDGGRLGSVKVWLSLLVC